MHIHTYVHNYVYIFLWQPRVEIEHYSDAYFDHVTVFKEL